MSILLKGPQTATPSTTQEDRRHPAGRESSFAVLESSQVVKIVVVSHLDIANVATSTHFLVGAIS